MKALILRGKRRGDIVEVSQFCNDWFALEDDNKPYLPTSLAFRHVDMQKIMTSENPGMLFEWFVVRHCINTIHPEYDYTFKRKK